MTSRRRFTVLVVIILSGTISRCSDPELNNLMDDYCNCIQKARFDQSNGYDECIEKMHVIKEKYQNQPRKLQKVYEKTDDCY